VEMTKNLSGSLTRVVFVPTMVAYGWIFLGYVRAGLILLLLFMLGAYRMRLFEHVRSWPAISRITLISGAPLICLGLYFSTLTTATWMVIPAAAYAILGIGGGAALKGKSYGSGPV